MSRALAPENGGVAVPRYLLDDKAGRAWLEVYDPRSATRSWDSGDVDFALKEAFTLLRRIGGRLGPRGDAGFWPAICRGLDDEDSGPERSSRRIETAAITQMEQVLDWLRTTPGAYLKPDTPERNTLMLWCWCIERNQKWARVVTKIGAKKPTQDRLRRRASLSIAAGLCRDDVRIPRSILLARLERPTSDLRNDPLDELAEAARHDPDAVPDPSAVPTSREVPGWPIPVFWEEIEKAQAVEEPAARANAVLAVIIERVRAEHGGSNFDAALRAADRRWNQLVSEAVRRGLLDRAAARARQLSKDELSERVRILRGEP